MDNNNIAIMSSAPEVTVEPTKATVNPSVQPANYNNPLRLKICIPNKKDSFTAYNMPASLPINGYMTYNYRLSGSNNEYTGTAKIYPISSNSILSQQSEINNLSYIFDINSVNFVFQGNYYIPNPQTAYIDFSGFNTVTYSNYKGTFSYYRVAYIDSTVFESTASPYRYVTNNIKPSTVMMQNIGWLNNTGKLKNYIGTGNLYKYVINPNTLNDVSQISQFLEYYNNFHQSTGGILIDLDWSNDTVAGETTCMPVSWNKNSQCLFYFDSTNARITINGFSELWAMSKFTRMTQVVDEFQKSSNNMAWISQLDLYNKGNDGNKRFNDSIYNYFLIYDTMPVQYKPSNNTMFQFQTNFVNTNNNVVTGTPLQNIKTTPNILNELYCNIVLSTRYQSLPNPQYQINRFITENYNIYDTRTASIITPGSFRHYENGERNGFYLYNTYIAQFNKYIVNKYTYLGQTLVGDSESSNTNFYIWLNRPGMDSKDCINNYQYTLIPLQYKVNNDNNDYISYVHYDLQVHVHACSSTEPDIITPVQSNGENVFISQANLNSKTSEYIYNINDSKHTFDLNVVGRLNYNSGEYETVSSVKPMVGINIAYSTQKIHFKYNGNPFNVKNGIDGKKLFRGSNTTYSNITTTGLGGNNTVIYDLLECATLAPVNNTPYMYSVSGNYSYLLHTSYATCLKDGYFYRDNITFSLDSSVIYTGQHQVRETDPIKPGLYCFVTTSEPSSGKYAYAPDITDNAQDNVFSIGNFNWYDGAFNNQEVTVNFVKIPEIIDKKIIYKFGNSKTDQYMTVLPHTAIISKDNKPTGYMLYSDNETPVEIVMSVNTEGSQVTAAPYYINSGFYTDNFEMGKYAINVFTGFLTQQPLSYYSNYKCTEATVYDLGGYVPKISNSKDGGVQLSLYTYIKNAASETSTVYLNAENIFNDRNCTNILPCNNMNTYLFSYYQRAYTEVMTDLYIDNSEKSELITLGTHNNVFMAPITLYAQASTYNMVVSYEYAPIINSDYPISIKSEKMVNQNGNIVKLNNVAYIINHSISYKDSIGYLHSVQIGSEQKSLSFDISAYEYTIGEVSLGRLTQQYSTIKPNKYYIDLTKRNTTYNGKDSDNELINNRFLLMDNKLVPSRDIIHESLKNIAGKYKCDYLNQRYDSNVGIDIYMHQYYNAENLRTYRDSTSYIYSKKYNDKFTKHYIYTINTTLQPDDFKQMDVNNIYYNIKNNTGIDVIVDGVQYSPNDYITIQPNSSKSLNLYDLIEISDMANEEEFRPCIYSLTRVKKEPDLLTAYINTVKPVDTKQTSTELNPKWIDADGRIKFNLDNIKDITDYDRQYSINNNYNIININLSDIVTVSDNNIVNVKNVQFGFKNDRFDIFDRASINKYNTEWTNFLNFIEKNTSYKLSDYVQFQITGFQITNWNQNNCYLKYTGDYIETTSSGKAVLENVQDKDQTIYSLFNTDINTFELPYKVSDLKFQYQISLSNYSFIVYARLYTSKNSDDGDNIILYFRLGNSDLMSEKMTVSTSNNLLDFGTLYITDSLLANINQNLPGCLYFNPISDRQEDNYEVLIDFYTDSSDEPVFTTRSGEITVSTKTVVFNLKEYISTNIDNKIVISYISIRQIKTADGDVNKYILTRR